jgi:hypothetical protein
VSDLVFGREPDGRMMGEFVYKNWQRRIYTRMSAVRRSRRNSTE